MYGRLGMKEILKELKSRVLVASGAQGTELGKRGFPLGGNYAVWGLKHPEALKEIIRSYVACGVDILSASCISTNRFRLAHLGMEDASFRLSKEITQLTRKLCPDHCYVGGSLSDIGHLLKPWGEVSVETAYNSYREQVLGMAEGGVDFVWVLTMSDINAATAAIKAVKENSDLPVFASMAFDSTPKGPRTMMGTGPGEAAQQLDQAGADVVGLNCGKLSMDGVDETLKKMAEASKKPLISKPNAGIPSLEQGETIYPLSAEEMAARVEGWIANGARIVSGCCGSGPDHISRISQVVKNAF